MQLSPEKIQSLVTVANARAWEAETDKFVFCVDLLEISATEPDADHWVDILERRFETLIAAIRNP